jgi:heterodisulfide reductase subunit A-like polyferredoxin
VIVLGATPEGIAATNKLGELGVPVTLVAVSYTHLTLPTNREV